MLPAQTLRQILVMSGLAFCCISDGFIFGQMSGMIDALHNDEESFRLSDDDISWIASIINVICFLGFGWMTILAETFGRRKALSILSGPVVLSWIMVYLAHDRTVLLISRVIVGVSFGGVVLLSFVCVGEYVSPPMRPLCLNMISSFGTNAGTMLGHVLSTFMHWRNVALIGIIPSALSTIIPLFWVESPSWLASKGQYKKCEKAFMLLHKPSEAANNELNALIANQNDQGFQHSNSFISLIRTFLNAAKKKYFWKISLLLSIVVIYRVVAGRIFFSTFAITMLQEITCTSDIFLFTLLVDGFMMIGTTLACILVTKLSMRFIIIKLGIFANIVQLLLALSLYSLQERDDYVVWIKVLLISLYFIIVNAGPYAVIDTLVSELFPLDIKTILMPIMGIISGVMQFLSIKFAPIMFKTIGYHGVFFINCFLAFICLIYLYIYLPETKGKTLQEIEFYFKYDSFKSNKKTFNEQERELLNVGTINK